MSHTVLSSSHARRIVFIPTTWLEGGKDSKDMLLFKLKDL